MLRLCCCFVIYSAVQYSEGSIFLTPNKAAMWLACEAPRRAAQHCLADAFTVHVQLSMLKPEMLLVYSQIFVTFVLDAVP